MHTTATSCTFSEILIHSFAETIFLTDNVLKKWLSRIDLLLVSIHIPVCVLSEILLPLLENEASCHKTHGMPFYPLDPPKLRYGNRN